jgi:menaquinone-dependent protoporphyrinogen oxidase
MKETTRREFIVNGSIVVGAAISGMGLGGWLHSPNRATAGEISFPEPSCGTDKGKEKPILIAYASYCGSTCGVAEAIARAFCEKGAMVDVRLAKNVPGLEGYRAVVVGSAVRSASWWPEALSFVSQHEKTLAQMPVAYFLTCLALYNDTPEDRKRALGCFDPVLKASPGVKPVDMGCFAGALDYSKMGFVYRTVMKSKMKDKGVPEGDFRDWAAIKAWAESVFPYLTEHTEAQGKS